MDDDEIRARFDGRSRVELLPGLVTAARRHRIDDIAHALGYRLLEVWSLGPAGTGLRYQRDDAPHARRRAEQTIARLRAGGPVLSEIQPAPPPPSAPPPAPTGQRPRRPCTSTVPGTAPAASRRGPTAATGSAHAAVPARSGSPTRSAPRLTLAREGGRRLGSR